MAVVAVHSIMQCYHSCATLWIVTTDNRHYTGKAVLQYISLKYKVAAQDSISTDPGQRINKRNKPKPLSSIIKELVTIHDRCAHVCTAEQCENGKVFT